MNTRLDGEPRTSRLSLRCHICDSGPWKMLGSHIAARHQKVDLKEYYEGMIERGEVPDWHKSDSSCLRPGCDEKARFLGINAGYGNFCSQACMIEVRKTLPISALWTSKSEGEISRYMVSKGFFHGYSFQYKKDIYDERHSFMRLDFYHPNLFGLKVAVEIDGWSHYNQEAQEKDNKRDQTLHNNGVQVFRYWEPDVSGIDFIPDLIELVEHGPGINGPAKEGSLCSYFNLSRQLSSIRRYSREHQAKSESVLEHVGWVAMIGWMIAEEVKEAGTPVNFVKLFGRIIYHDVEEAIHGDVSRPLKYANEALTKMIKETELLSVMKIADQLKMKTMVDYWKTAKTQDDIEGWILRITDYASVIYKTWLEVIILGNSSFLRIAEDSSIELNALCQSVQEDCKNQVLIDIMEQLRTINSNILGEFARQLGSGRTFPFDNW